ncbi:hypothetical protein Bbelb_416600 [Branchiostoma belcheri]|nr:hypothetical protein Bbelb_416600 [Branchiostoma belcheri]
MQRTIMEWASSLRYSLLLLTMLRIASAAFYRIRPQSTGVLVNQTVTLYCAFNGLTPSEVVNWYWYNPETDDKLYHISARGRVASEFSRHSIVGSSRRGEYNLRIRDVQPGDEGNYRCSVFTVRDAGDARLTVVVHHFAWTVLTSSWVGHWQGPSAALCQCRKPSGRIFEPPATLSIQAPDFSHS